MILLYDYEVLLKRQKSRGVTPSAGCSGHCWAFSKLLLHAKKRSDDNE